MVPICINHLSARAVPKKMFRTVDLFLPDHLLNTKIAVHSRSQYGSCYLLLCSKNIQTKKKLGIINNQIQGMLFNDKTLFFNLQIEQIIISP